VDILRIDTRPLLNKPIVICAFAGWNDAASAATNAARFVVRRLGARRFASFDAEPLFEFTETRPSVRITARGEREITWPTNDFFYARNPTGPHDVVVFIGTEPGLHWGGFAREQATLFRDLEADVVLSLGALLADVPHTRPVRVTGSAMRPELNERYGLQPSRYEGPTGIVGVVHEALRAEGVASASFWANVPHYITTSQNPPATAALLQRIQPIVGMEFDLSELETAGERFRIEVDTALSANPEVKEYVNRLEEAFDGPVGDEAGAEAGELPQGVDLVTDIEEFLRSQQRGDEDPGSAADGQD